MIIGSIVNKGVESMPKKGEKAPTAKYPFAEMTMGDQIFVLPEVEDGTDAASLKKLKKTISSAAKQFERRLGKNVAGKKIKDFAVWIGKESYEDEDAPNGVTVLDGVFIGCREDNSSDAAAPAPKSVPKKKGKQAE